MLQFGGHFIGLQIHIGAAQFFLSTLVLLWYNDTELFCISEGCATTEKEKCKLGQLYDANYDKALLEERTTCKELCYQFNQLRPSESEAQEQIIRKLFGKTGKTFTITAPFYCDYGYNIEIGENFYTNHNCVILDCAKVTIGDNVFIAPNCCFSTAGHPIDYARRNAGLEFARPIVIGNHVWIGANVTILPGVTIGDYSVIGAGSVVNKDIPANVVAVGNPCKVLREIIENEKPQ